MRTIIAILLTGLLTSIAFAQQPQSQPEATAREQALSQRLLQEMSTSISCDTARMQMQQEISKLQARVRELEAPKK